jgi:hypothetical protein
MRYLDRIFRLSFLVFLVSSCTDDEVTAMPVIPELNTAITVYNPAQFNDDYLLITPMREESTYLIDRQGNLIHEWQQNNSSILMGYLHTDGSVIRCVNSPLDFGISFGGKTGTLQKINKDNELVWEWSLNNPNEVLHHDISVLPNGNILATVWEVKNSQDSIEAGRDPQLLLLNRIVMDKIIEIKPIGDNDAEIVWEWSLWDHLVQDYDATKSNYGSLSTNPQLVNINYTNGDDNFTHINSIDYIEEYDQIVMNSRNLNEFFVIDHSTTTAEASSNSGGNYGKGGDLLYRYGNPQIIDPLAAAPYFDGPHDATFVGNNDFSLGTFLIFNNNQDINISSVIEIDSGSSNGFYPSVNGNLSSQSQVWNYESGSIYSRRTSGAQRLDNGNTLITATTGNVIREVDFEGNTVWEYNFEVEDLNDFNMGSNAFKVRSYSKDSAAILSLLME